MRTRLLPPYAAYSFGTDEFGRDVLSRVLVGDAPRLAMGFGATAISLAIGVPLGLLAAFHRGWVDEAIMRGADLLIAVPPILLGLLVLAVTPPALGRPRSRSASSTFRQIARLARSVTLSPRQRGFRPGREGARRKHLATSCSARSCRTPGRR